MAFRHPVKIEAYNSVIIRDWWANTQRNETARQWRVDVKLHCETQDSNAIHRGVFTIVIYHPETEEVLYRLLEPAVIIGDDNREATYTVVSPILIDFSKVLLSHAIWKYGVM